MPDTWGDSLVSVNPNQVLSTNATGNIISIVKTASSIPNSLVLRDSFSAIAAKSILIGDTSSRE